MARVLTGPSASHDPVAIEAGRTALEWTRTALALVVNAAVVIRAGVSASHDALVMLGAILVGAAIVAAGLGAWRRRRLAASPHAPPAASGPLMAGTLAACWIACAAAVFVVTGIV
jgi:uncharacterized membrane protein YidH (DUF202 family)